MALISLTPRSIRPHTSAVVLGVGTGSGSTLDNLFKTGTAAAHLIDMRVRADTASGSDARVLYARFHQYGAGGGEAVRAYSIAGAANVATGGTLNGLHATMEIGPSGATISGQAFGARVTLAAQSVSRTISGNVAALCVESDIAASNTVPATVALVHLKEIGSVSCKKAFRFPTVASAGMLAAHTTDAMTHSIRCVDDAGTVLYLMATTTATNRTGGA